MKDFVIALEINVFTVQYQYLLIISENLVCFTCLSY